MSWTTVINNVTYTSPDPGENFWGDQVKSWMQAVSGTGSGQGGMLKKDGGLFQVLSEVNFGTAFGIKALTYTSGSAAAGSAAGAGVVRLKRADVIGWRNEADSANLALSVSSSNWIQWQGVDLADISSAQTLTNKSMSGSSNTFTNIGLASIIAPAAGVVISNGSLISSETRLSLARTADGTLNYVLVAAGAGLSPAYALIVNANVSASAAIAYSKLALTDSIVNADINSAAAIAYSKLNLTGSIVNADVSASAAIAYSKLNLAGSIVNTDISASAAIARSKLAVGTADHVVINSGTGAFSSEAQLAVSRGGTGLGSLGTANQMLGVNSGATANEYKTLAVGTSGTDFAIAHSAGTVTFNLPTASASNRGALSTADWSTFNAKIGGSGNNGQVALFNGGSSLTSSSNIAYNLGSNANNIVLTSGIKIGMNTTVAATAGSGSIRYNAGVLEYSDGASWIALAASAGGILAINGLTPASQFLAVGTAGTDFAIVDAVDTHTFNLPTASGTNRGALSSADWTTFNNKQAAGNYITALTGDVTASGPGSVAATVAVIGGVTVSGATGSTNVVFSNSPTLVTPVLGVASATSINKVAITAPATSATLTIADGKTFTVSNTLTFTGTDSSSVAFGGGGTVIYSGGAPSFTNITLTNTTNQIVLGTTNTVTISSVAQAASRTFTIPVVAGSSNFVMTAAGTTDTLLGTIVGSSLTSVGTITTGVWNAGAVTSSGAVSGTIFLGGAGSTSAPTHSFSSDSDTGIYNYAANVIGFTLGNNNKFRMSATDFKALAADIYVQNDGTNTIGGGSILALANNAVDRFVYFQLDASNNMMLARYNGTTQDKIVSFGQDQVTTFSKGIFAGTTTNLFSTTGSFTIQDTNAVIELEFSGATNDGINVDDTNGSAGTDLAINFRRGGSQVGYIGTTTTATSYNTSSDLRLKDNIQDLKNSIDIIKKISARTYEWKFNKEKSIGFIAQEVLPYYSEAVCVPKDSNSMMAVDYGKMTPILWQALKETIEKVEYLEVKKGNDSELKELIKEVSSLKQQLEVLQRMHK